MSAAVRRSGARAGHEAYGRGVAAQVWGRGATGPSGAGELCLLGPVRRPGLDGDAILGGRQPRLLLVYLVLAGGRPVPDDELAEVLWVSGRSVHWAGALRGVVAKVRAFLSGADCAIANVGRTYRFEPAGATIDVHRAEQLVLEADRSLASDDPATVRDCAEVAAALLRPGLLPGEDAPWLEPWRSHLGSQLRRALRVSSTALVALGAVDDGVDRAREAVALDPLDERSHRTLMAAHLAAGSRASALRAYEQCRRVLGEELGVAPSDTTEACYLDVLGVDGGPPRPPPTPIDDGGVVAPAPGGSPFVGRQFELARLASAWEAARRGERQVVLLHGGAGVGKTFLALGAVRRFAPDTVLYGRSSAEPLVPLEPFAEALGRHLADVGGAGPVGLAEAAVALADALPPVAARLGRAPGGRSMRGVDVTAVVEPARSVLALVATSPTILVIDDLHLADDDTLLLARHLLHALDGARLLVIVTYCDDGGHTRRLSQTITELHRAPGCQAVRVGGLDVDAVTDLLRLAGVAAAEAVAPTVAARTGGNGVYLSQMLAAARDAPGAFDPAAVPESVTELVGHRVALLTPTARLLLQAATVLGTSVAPASLATAGGLPELVHLDALDELVARGFLREADDGALAFVHELVRDAVLDRLVGDRRRFLERQVARDPFAPGS